LLLPLLLPECYLINIEMGIVYETCQADPMSTIAGMGHELLLSLTVDDLLSFLLSLEELLLVLQKG
jgi:hypothetical protein